MIVDTPETRLVISTAEGFAGAKLLLDDEVTFGGAFSGVFSGNSFVVCSTTFAVIAGAGGASGEDEAARAAALSSSSFFFFASSSCFCLFASSISACDCTEAESE